MFMDFKGELIATNHPVIIVREATKEEWQQCIKDSYNDIISEGKKYFYEISTD